MTLFMTNAAATTISKTGVRKDLRVRLPLEGKARKSKPLHGEMVDTPVPKGIHVSAIPCRHELIGKSSNGRTMASGAIYRGSNPCFPATSFRVRLVARRWPLKPPTGVRSSHPEPHRGVGQW